MRPGQDASVLTELGQLSPEAVPVPGHLAANKNILSLSLITQQGLFFVQSPHLSELSGQALALLLYGDKLAGLRSQRCRARRGERTLQRWTQGAIDLLLQEG